MATEEAFMAARVGFILLNSFVNRVAQEVGEDRAFALMAEMCESVGTMRGQMLKGQSEIKDFDAGTAWSLVKTLKDTLGESHEVLEESSRRVLVKNGRCPFYAAAQMLGVDAGTIEARCRAGPMRLADAVVKQLNPRLNLQICRFRSTPDESCEEEIVLA